jgi:uncharacterized membrane protein/Mg-chelatase subunit ChlD
MQAILSFLGTHWFAAALLAFALIAVGIVVLCRRVLDIWIHPLLWLFGGLGFLALGGLTLTDYPGFAKWLGYAGLVCLFCVLLTLILAGFWSRWAGYVVGGMLMLALGGLALPSTSEGIVDTARSVRTVEFVEPWWLLVLLAVPVVWALAWRTLDVEEALRRRRVESFRPWVGVLLRTALVVFLALALAEPRVKQSNENMTVLFVLDQSESVPAEYDANGVDLRAQRVLDFINQSVAKRGAGHERDKVGLIVFGRRPRLELPPAVVPRFNLAKLPDKAVDGSYTDIAAALKLGIASFPDDTGKRIVLISDGNENLGNAEEVAAYARQAGVQIDVLPLAAGQRNTDEVLVERVEVPPFVEQGAQVPIRVLVRSFNPNVVIAKLTLKQITEGSVSVVGEPVLVKLKVGLNTFSFKRPLTEEQRSYTYEAEIQPVGIKTAGKDGDDDPWLFKGRLPGDRVENNKASKHVVARGQRRILILEGQEGANEELARALTNAGDKKFRVNVEPITVLERYPGRDKLAVYLSNFDCVILANVSKDQVTEEQEEAIRTNTHDQGCGLVMIGGPDSFGAGGWQNTIVEKALPVDSDIKSLKVEGKGGLVLIMHASEMADGNFWQKKIAKLAIERLAPSDEVGVIDFDWQCKWVINFQEVGGKRPDMLKKIDAMMPGDMPDFGPAVQMAHDALAGRKDLTVKHVIIISDGDPIPPAQGLLNQMRAAKMTVTTVGVATHGAPQDQAMQNMAIGPKGAQGNYYKVTDPTKLPAIYIKESRIVSQSFVQEKKFEPRVHRSASGPTARLPDKAPELGGFVRTTPKNNPLVEVPIVTPPFENKQDFPVLAYWHYGLGKSVAYTSDAGNPKFWSKKWAEDKEYVHFWEYLAEWAMRPNEKNSKLQMTTEYRDGKVKVVVEARDDNDKPNTKLTLRGGISRPGKGDGELLEFKQTNSGRYELEVKAEDAGSYFVTAQAVEKVKVVGRDGQTHEVERGVASVRGGETVPYSPEFADQETNEVLLRHLRDLTDGTSYKDNWPALEAALAAGDVFRPGLPRTKSLLPLWQWLLFATGVLLFFDVAVRRVSIDAPQVMTTALNWWARLRGLPIRADGRPEFMERLQTRKQQVEARTRTTARFEGGADVSLPLGADATAPTSTAPPPRAQPTGKQETAPQPESEPGDAMSRLARAKKRAQDQRRPDKNP